MGVKLHTCNKATIPSPLILCVYTLQDLVHSELLKIAEAAAPKDLGRFPALQNRLGNAVLDYIKVGGGVLDGGLEGGGGCSVCVWGGGLSFEAVGSGPVCVVVDGCVCVCGGGDAEVGC